MHNDRYVPPPNAYLILREMYGGMFEIASILPFRIQRRTESIEEPAITQTFKLSAMLMLLFNSMRLSRQNHLPNSFKQRKASKSWGIKLKQTSLMYTEAVCSSILFRNSNRGLIPNCKQSCTGHSYNFQSYGSCVRVSAAIL